MKLNEFVSDERWDALDDLIVSELGKQQQWRDTMDAWEARRRQQRRLRLAPVISNLFSVAALMVVGFILQALIPQTRLADETSTERLFPVLEHFMEADSTTAVRP